MPYQKANNLNFYEPAVFQALWDRLEQLPPIVTRQWGV